MSNAGGTEFGYVIQGRAITEIPHVLSGGPLPLVLVKDRWTTIPTTKVRAGLGVPNPVFNSIADEQGLLDYRTATALCASFAATMSGGQYVEFRLMKQKLTFSWKIEDEGTTEPFTWFDRERKETVTPLAIQASPSEEAK